MFSIMANGKYVKFDEGYNSIGLTQTPKIYKNIKVALETLQKIKDLATEQVENYQGFIEQEQKVVESAQTKLSKLEQQIEESMDLPYREVYKKVPKIQEKIESLKWDIKSTSIPSWQRDIRRLTKIRDAAQVVRVSAKPLGTEDCFDILKA